MCLVLEWNAELQRFMGELGKEHDMGTLYSDNQSAIHLAKNSTFHSRTKHIQLKYHFIWLVLEDGELMLEKIHTSQNPADMLTKVVTKEKLRTCSVSIGLQGWRWRWKNSQVQRGVIVQQMKQQWSCYNHSPSGRLLCVEHDCSKVFCFSRMYTLGSLYTPPHRGVQGGLIPPTGVQGGRSPPAGGSGDQWSPSGGSGAMPPKPKNRCKIAL